MTSVLFSNVNTGETIQRNYDATGNLFRDTIIARRENAVSTVNLSPCQARKQANKRDAIILAHMNYRAKQAKPVRYGRKALQAINYLLGDKYRDNRTMQEKRNDDTWQELCKTGTMAERMAYLDNARANLVNAILGDRETIEACKRFLYHREDVVIA